MSPSEELGHVLGIRMLSITSAKHSVLPSHVLPGTRVVVKFQAELRGHRRTLVAYTKSRAGAWQAAIRWLRRMERGELT